MPIYTGVSKQAGPNSLDASGNATNTVEYPEGSAFSAWGRVEPLLTPDLLKSRFLKGIPLTLKIKDPSTGKPFVITDDELKDYIDQAVSEAEDEVGMVIMPTQFLDKLPFQKQDFEQFGYFQLPRRPVSSIEALNVTLADGSDVFDFPLQWIETSNMIHGQVNILPLAFQGLDAGTGIIGGGINAGGGTAVFFNSLWNRPWVAALFGFRYTAGFKNGLVPKTVNQLVGTITALHVLSQIAAAYALYTSVSLGIDGMSQSQTTPGPQRYVVRIGELEKDKDKYVRKLKKIFGTGFVAGTV